MRSIAEIYADLEKITRVEREVELRIIDDAVYAIDKETGLETSPINIKNATRDIAQRMIDDTSFELPVLIHVMDGVFPFGADLQKELNNKQYSYQYQTIQTSSYHGTQSTGKVSVQFNLKIPVAGRNVYVIDELVDTGNTYVELYRRLKAAGAKEIRLVTLGDKRQERDPKAQPWTCGFILSKEAFVGGMGLDIDGWGRNIPYIFVVDPKMLPTEEEKSVISQKPKLIEELKQAMKEELTDKLVQNLYHAAVELSLENQSSTEKNSLKEQKNLHGKTYTLTTSNIALNKLISSLIDAINSFVKTNDIKTFRENYERILKSSQKQEGSSSFFIKIHDAIVHLFQAFFRLFDYIMKGIKTSFSMCGTETQMDKKFTNELHFFESHSAIRPAPQLKSTIVLERLSKDFSEGLDTLELLITPAMTPKHAGA